MHAHPRNICGSSRNLRPIFYVKLSIRIHVLWGLIDNNTAETDKKRQELFSRTCKGCFRRTGWFWQHFNHDTLKVSTGLLCHPVELLFAGVLAELEH